jgi:cysteine synthase
MKTPLIEINGIHAKLETHNLTGSIKDRMVSHILDQAEKRGELTAGQQIIEVTSGNTGVALAALAAKRGYKFTAVMPESMSLMRRQMMMAFGAELVLTPAKQDIAGAIKKYNELVAQNPDAYLPLQFENPDNVHAHELGLGPEILKEVPNVDAFVAGAGTGGTLIGVARALPKNVKIIVVEPAESAVLSGGDPGLHGIQGIGEGFIPHILQENLHLIDEIITIKTQDAVVASQQLAAEHGFLVGISSGANFLAAQQLKNRFNNVVTVFPDRGERYFPPSG